MPRLKRPLEPGERLRRKNVDRHRPIKSSIDFINPYPWMSSIEARVHLDLERRRVPFSWRFFDGDSISMKTLIPDFAPEFTLKEYKIVILIIGSFWGTLPGIIDKNALAQAILEEEGWKVATFYEADILQDVHSLINKTLPDLVNPAITGPVRPNPYGNPDLMKRRREQLRRQALLRRIFPTDGGQSSARRRIRKRAGIDGNRLRRPRNS